MSKFLEWWIKLSGNEEATLIHDYDIAAKSSDNFACASFLEYGGTFILTYEDPLNLSDVQMNFPDLPAFDNWLDVQLKRMQ